jgi:prevent-host-death family protein
MRTFSIRAAKTHLSRLIDQAAKGESFVITKAGKPLVRVTALGATTDDRVESEGSAPSDPDETGAADIEAPFEDEV